MAITATARAKNKPKSEDVSITTTSKTVTPQTARSMAVIKLPSNEETDKSLIQSHPFNEEKWRNICLLALSYGTDCNHITSPSTTKSSASTTDEQRYSLKLKLRTSKTITFFREALTRYETHHPTLFTTSTPSAPVTPHTILIDCVWLISTLHLPPSPLPADDKILKDETTTFGALLQIIAHLSKFSEYVSTRMQIQLEPSTLGHAHLVSSDFCNRFRRYQTNQVYRQRRFNLLVEETEGYTKLLCLLMHGVCSCDEEGQVIGERVRGLIGAFDLDPNRCLDLSLTVLEHEFKSERGSGREKKAVLLKLICEFEKESVVDLMGFKVSGYLKNANGECSIPAELYDTIAFLACHDVLDLKDLIAYFPITVEETFEIYVGYIQKLRKQLKVLGRVSLNQDNSSGTNKEEEKKDNAQTLPSNSPDKKELEKALRSNPFLILSEALVRMGAWDKAKYLIKILNLKGGKGVACLLHNSLGEAICAMIHDMIEPLYHEKFRSVSSFLSHQQGLKKIPSSDGITDLDQFVSGIYEPILAINQSGIIAKDAILYVKLCRLFAILIQNSINDEVPLDPKLHILLSTFLIPSLSLFPSNVPISSTVWKTISSLPISTRFSLYDSWSRPGLEKSSLTFSLHPKKPVPRIHSEILSGQQTRYIMKRLSKENFRETSCLLAKVAHSNPLVVFRNVLTQVESYDNLVDILIDTFKYMSKLSLDVIGYCLLGSLGGGMTVGTSPGRQKLKSDGINPTQWLSSLISFTGQFYKKYPDISQMTILLSYLLHNLYNHQTSEDKTALLEVTNLLNTLLRIPGGYDFAYCENTANLSELQAEGRGGSQSLKRETNSFGVVKAANRKSCRILREVLFQKNIGMPFLVVLSNVRSRIFFELKEAKKPTPLKVLGSLFDSVTSVMLLLLEFLTNSLEDEELTIGSSPSSTLENKGANQNKSNGKEQQNIIAEYAAMMPTLGELTSGEYKGVDCAMGWMLCRPLIRAALFVKDTKRELPSFLTPYLPGTTPMTESYSKMIPSSSWDSITPVLFETFWSLSLYDIASPGLRYDTEIIRLKKEAERLEVLQNRPPQTIYHNSGPEAAPVHFTKDDQTELDRVKKHAERLEKDKLTQMEHVTEIQNRFFHSNMEMFKNQSSPDPTHKNSTQIFLGHCIFPRCLLSPEDAIYAAKFVLQLQTSNIPNFYIVEYIQEMINCLVGSLYCFTEDEAGNFSMFLQEIWKIMVHWCHNISPSSFTTLKLLKRNTDPSLTQTQNVTHEEFVQIYNTLHSTLASALIGCLSSKESIHTRTALLILARLVNTFPTQQKNGQQILSSLVTLQKDQERPDVKNMAISYHGQLCKARDDNNVWRMDKAALTKIKNEAKLKIQLRKEKSANQQKEMEMDNKRIQNLLGTEDRGRGGRDHGGGRSGPNANRRAGPPPSFTPPANNNVGMSAGTSRDHKSNTREPSVHREYPRDSHHREHRFRDATVGRGGPMPAHHPVPSSGGMHHPHVHGGAGAPIMHPQSLNQPPRSAGIPHDHNHVRERNIVLPPRGSVGGGSNGQNMPPPAGLGPRWERGDGNSHHPLGHSPQQQQSAEPHGDRGKRPRSPIRTNFGSVGGGGTSDTNHNKRPRVHSDQVVHVNQGPEGRGPGIGGGLTEPAAASDWSKNPNLPNKLASSHDERGGGSRRVFGTHRR